MALDWSTEGYVRLYKRETADDLCLTWEAEAIWHKFLKKCDPSGLIETRKGVPGLAAALRIPLEVVERALGSLLEDGRIRSLPDKGFLAPNYVEANFTAQSPGARKQRQRMSERARTAIDSATNGSDKAASIATGVSHDGIGHDVSRDVTASHATSHEVTNSHHPIPIHPNSDPPFPPSGGERTVKPSRAKPRARIAPDWKPRACDLELARQLGLNGEAEAAEFLSYWLGDGRPKADWDQTFVNRLRSQAKPRGRQQYGLRIEEPRVIPEL